MLAVCVARRTFSRSASTLRELSCPSITYNQFRRAVVPTLAQLRAISPAANAETPSKQSCCSVIRSQQPHQMVAAGFEQLGRGRGGGRAGNRGPQLRVHRAVGGSGSSGQDGNQAVDLATKLSG